MIQELKFSMPGSMFSHLVKWLCTYIKRLDLPQFRDVKQRGRNPQVMGFYDSQGFLISVQKILPGFQQL